MDLKVELKKKLDILFDEDMKDTMVTIPYMHPSDVVDMLQDEYDAGETEQDSNGWQHDFWLEFEKGEKKYCFSGSWYSGGYRIAEAEDEE